VPLYELQCAACQAVEERYLRHWDDPTPDCPICLGPRVRLASNFGVVFSGPLTRKYMDPKKEGAYEEGFWAYRKRSSISGELEPVFLDTWDKLREFNKAEGLSAPGDAPTNATISSDGKRILSNGMPGQWQTGMPSMPARLKEIIEMPADQIPQAAATATPCMPIGYGVSVEAVEPPAEMGKA
jgi:putative FmdB family regulatory protein